MSIQSPPRSLTLRRLPWLALMLLCFPAHAQLRVPTLPSLPTVPMLPAVQRGLSVDNRLAPTQLEGLRRRNIDQLLRLHPAELERDPAGEPVVRGEVLAMPSSPQRRDEVLASGFVLLREQVLEGLDERWLVLRPGSGDVRAALERLRQADPAGHYDYHHVYTGSGDMSTLGGRSIVPAAAVSSTSLPADRRIGLIDAGIDRNHPALRGIALQRHGCEGKEHASVHGTAVASLLVGHADGFKGAWPEAALFAADVYCDAATGGSVEAVAQGLAWLVRERVPVINISLVGPANRLLERVVAAVVARGHLLVASVGNDGPAAPPLYPAAWPGVVAVSGTDARQRLLPEAGRGPHVMFTAPGADQAAAAAGDSRYLPVRGTSFAAPWVAGLLGALLAEPDVTQAGVALAALSHDALDLGPPGRDPGYGIGLVGAGLRIDPHAVSLAVAR